MGERTVTLDEYVQAFRTWAGVARLSDGEQALLDEALAYVATFAPGDGAARPVGAWCETMTRWYEDRAVDVDNWDLGALRLAVVKSCLLDRLLYCGEALRTRPCPEHQGRWSGCCRRHPCPHGCDGPCGCRTGWVP